MMKCLLIAGMLTTTALTAQVPGLTGTIIVTNKSPSTATIIDVASGRTLATLPTGPGPHEIAITANGATAVVTDYSGPIGTRKTLTVLDVPGMKVVRTIELGQYVSPHGIQFLPGDSLVVVTSEGSNNVIIVHVASGEIRKAIPTNFPGSHMIGVTANGTRGYTSNGRGNSVSELDLKGGTFLKSWPVPNGPEAINVTPDGKEVWVGSNTTHVVSVLDPATGTITQVADSVAWPYRVLFTPDVKTVIIPDLGNEHVRFIERSSRRELARIALPGAGPQGITMTPDAKYVLLSLSKQAKVAIIDMTTRAVVGHLAAGETPDGIVYSTRVLTGGR